MTNRSSVIKIIIFLESHHLLTVSSSTMNVLVKCKTCPSVRKTQTKNPSTQGKLASIEHEDGSFMQNNLSPRSWKLLLWRLLSKSRISSHRKQQRCLVQDGECCFSRGECVMLLFVQLIKRLLSRRSLGSSLLTAGLKETSLHLQTSRVSHGEDEHWNHPVKTETVTQAVRKLWSEWSCWRREVGSLRPYDPIRWWVVIISSNI